MSLSKNKIKYIQSLKDKKSREEHRTFVVEGDKMVSELIGFVKCQLLIATSDFIQTNQIHCDYSKLHLYNFRVQFLIFLPHLHGYANRPLNHW